MFNLNRDDAEYILSSALPGEDWIDRADKWAEYGCVWDGDAESIYAEAWEIIHPTYKYGVCRGRHDMPVEEYFFDEIKDVNDFAEMFRIAESKIPADAGYIELYVTGLTAATLAVVSACSWRGVGCIAYHYDKETGEYKPQRVLRSL